MYGRGPGGVGVANSMNTYATSNTQQVFTSNCTRIPAKVIMYGSCATKGEMRYGKNYH